MSDRDFDGGSDGFERATKRVFDAGAAALDAPTRSRLTQARFRALAELEPAARRSAWLRRFVPAGAAAAATLAAAWLVVWHGPQAGDLRAASLGDLEILLGEEDLEMLDEELEFYGWLEEQPEFAASLDGVG